MYCLYFEISQCCCKKKFKVKIVSFMGGIHKSSSIQFKGDNISGHAAVLSVPAYMFGVLSVTITIRFELKQKSCNSV